MTAKSTDLSDRGVGDYLRLLCKAFRAPPEIQDLQSLSLWWQEQALARSRRLFRSPLYSQVKALPQGRRAHYTYERSLWPTPLERVPHHPDWQVESLVCRNRAAAYWTALVTLRDMLSRPIRVRSWGLEPSLQGLLETMESSRWQVSQALSPCTFHSSLQGGRADFFLLAAEHWDLHEFAECWRVRQGEVPRLLWVDVTAAPDFERDALLDFLRCDPPWLLALVRAWQARDCGGLQLCWPGEVLFYGSPAPGMSVVATAAELGRRVRSVLGTGLSLAELAQWQLPTLPPGVFALEKGPEPGAKPSGPGSTRQTPRPGSSREEWLLWADSGAVPAPSELENRLVGYDSCVSPWQLRPLLMRSGMAALSSVLAALERLWRLDRPLRVASCGRYFESKFLEQVVFDAGAWQKVPLEQADVVFAESVDYDWDLQPLDLERLRGVRALVIDTTLTGQRLGLAQLQADLPALEWAVRIFSTLKLDQLGWEVENAGAVLVAGPSSWCQQLGDELVKLRRLTGNDLSESERRRLGLPFVLDPALASSHADAVFENNARLAHSLQAGGWLARVSHPTLGSKLSRAVAPFVVLHLKDSSIQAHRHLSAVLDYEARLRGLAFYRGASFGFVDHRHEFIIPVLRENRALFKVALGSGAAEGVIELLQEVLALDGREALRRAYPRVRLARPPRDWSAPSARLIRYLEGPEV